MEGTLVPFLGAGANLCGRPKDTAWKQGHYLPSGAELAAFLATTYDYPTQEVKLSCPDCHREVVGTHAAPDLLRVSQFVDVVAGGLGDLYRQLHRVFDADYPATTLHQFLALLPAALARKGYPQRQLLIVTTNYDDLMERAFRDAGQPFDTLTYMARGEHQGKFLHVSADGKINPIDRPNEILLPLDERPVVLKIHGAVNRGPESTKDSYVIREDDYIDYLARTSDITSVLPAALVAKLKESHLLFLGYSLSDWNLRVILHRIWSERELEYKSWAIQVHPQAIDQQFWSRKKVEILDVYLEEYVKELQVRIEGMAPGSGEVPSEYRHTA
jgi:hypothetical protein